MEVGVACEREEAREWKWVWNVREEVNVGAPRYLTLHTSLNFAFQMHQHAELALFLFIYLF